MAPRHGSPADSYEVTQKIKQLYIGRLVYFESVDLLQPGEMHLATHHALMYWWKNGKLPGFAMVRDYLGWRATEFRSLYEPPFKITEIPGYDSTSPNIRIINFREVHVINRVVQPDRTLSDNAERVELQPPQLDMPMTMFHKTMTPTTRPEHMILEAGRLMALRDCGYTPKLLGVTGDPKTGECRGLLMEWIEGQSLLPVPFMFNSQRVELTIELSKALLACEKRGTLPGDLKPENLMMTDDKLYIIDFGPGVTDGYCATEEAHNVMAGKVNVRAAMHMYLMTLRDIWAERPDCPRVLDDDSSVYETPLRKDTHPFLQYLLDGPKYKEYSTFGDLLSALLDNLV